MYLYSTLKSNRVAPTSAVQQNTQYIKNIKENMRHMKIKHIEQIDIRALTTINQKPEKT